MGQDIPASSTDSTSGERESMNASVASAIEIRRANDRGSADFGWLQSRHTFSFGEYHDAAHMGVSDLLVINEDRVAPGMGFGRHPHRDMEIFSYVLSGQLEHKDSMGTGSTITQGEVQVMSAGTGVTHSEFNASLTEPVHFLQIWIKPDRRGLKPSYQQKLFPASEKAGRLRLILSPDAADGSLVVNQDVWVYGGEFDGGQSAALNIAGGRIVYLHVARGSLDVNGVRLNAGDGARIYDATSLSLSNPSNADVLVFDLRSDG